MVWSGQPEPWRNAVDDPLNKVHRFLDSYLPPACKWILLLNVIVFVVAAILLNFGINLTSLGAFRSLAEIFFRPWTPLTYMFLHRDAMHLIFNMLGLWFFGPPLENKWGTRRFWQFYLVVGVGAALLNVLTNAVIPIDATRIPTLDGGSMLIFPRVIGASGAIMGLILAMTAYNPEGTIVLFPIPIPLQLKIFLVGAIVYALFGVLSHSDVSHSTHLCGVIMAYVWMAIYHRDWDFKSWKWR
jgi:membrane associated rhomboid family serine protease